MNNMYGSPAGPADGPGAAGLTDINAQCSPPRDRQKRMLRWGAAITLAGFLAGGGIALALSGGSSPAAATSPASGVSGPSGLSGASQAQGTTLNSELNTASSTGSLPRLRWALARLRALGGVDGEFTFHNSTGFHTLAFERGTIQSVSGSDVVVRASDGTTWTWLIVSDTVVRQNGSKTTASALAQGQSVFAGGPVASGAKDARLIVIRPGSSSSGSSSVSGPSGTSVS
ncbi:MAG TPA: hypothetical protein VK284_09695 [Streptosporangiaceae bacterium]|nr:hypothetical protein [Streptosporangiaceae bacterium]